MWCKDPLELFQLATIVQSDTEAPRYAVACLVGHTPDNEDSIILRGAELYKNGDVFQICILGGDEPYFSPITPQAKCGYSGARVWREKLQNLRVRRKAICEIPRPKLAHTGTEAERFIRKAKAEEWESAYVVAVPFHLLRAFTTFVTFALREYPTLRLYAKAGTPVPWTQKVVSSQGKTEGTRIAVMETEWRKLNQAYGNQYDLASCEEVIAYIEKRDLLLS